MKKIRKEVETLYVRDLSTDEMRHLQYVRDFETFSKSGRGDDGVDGARKRENKMFSVGNREIEKI